MAKGEIKNFKEFGGMSAEEVVTVITFLVEFEDRVDMVREEFEAIFNKRIKADTIYQIRDKYKDVIRDRRAKIAAQPRVGVIAMRRSIRMRLFQRLLRMAFKKELRYSVRTGQNEYTEIHGPDKKLALATLVAMEKCMNDAKRLELEEFRIMSELNQNEDDDQEEDDDGVDFTGTSKKA